MTLARLDMYRWRLDEARARLERAREQRPSDSVVLHYLAMVANMLDDHADAERLIREFEQAAAGRHVPPGLAAMARLAVGDYPAAEALLGQAIVSRRDGADPMPLLLIRLNTWADPVLEEPVWRALRARLGYTR